MKAKIVNPFLKYSILNDAPAKVIGIDLKGQVSLKTIRRALNAGDITKNKAGKLVRYLKIPYEEYDAWRAYIEKA